MVCGSSSPSTLKSSVSPKPQKLGKSDFSAPFHRSVTLPPPPTQRHIPSQFCSSLLYSRPGSSPFTPHK
ncbi:hypothetical protein E2C01_032300 [Portunus trituberculatus]|uniref:Uncharacterized protein n=1 Tax=Portunus trituberculatus TaxID=210409 RepID=A0A5B7F2F0_PORTR|nr:hypothetical protein [Portunus trituberculatus]